MRLPENVKGYINNINKSFNYAGLFVILMALTDSNDLNAHACPNPEKSYFKDWGKIFFITGFLFRFAAIPVLGNALNKLLKNKMPSQELMTLCESEILDSIETIIFILMLSLQSWNDAKPVSFLAVFAIWPIITVISHLFNASFSRGTIKEYKAYFDRKSLMVSATLAEGTYNAISLASAASVLWPLIVNVSYNSTHHGTMNHYKSLLNFFMGAGLVIGTSSVLHPKIMNFMRFSEGAINGFYYLFMFMISSFYCATPNLMNDAGFESYGWSIALLSGVLSLILGYFAGKNNQSFGYQEASFIPLFGNTPLLSDSHRIELFEREASCFSKLSSAVFSMKNKIRNCLGLNRKIQMTPIN